jgi:MoaA/NifB/PqqE/SkfB family radical SAM enzyme
LDRLKKLSPFKAILSGGEPLILPGIERVIGSLDNSGCSVYVATNGVVSVPQELLTHVDCFDIHIDGTNETVYERSMGKGNFGRVVDNIRMLIAAGAQVRLSCVVNRANYEDAFAFPDFCRLLGVSRLEMIRLLPLGRAKETDLFVDEASMQRLYAEVGNPSDMTIHFMYANIEKTDRWYGDYPVFDSQGNQLKLPGRTFSGTTIFDDDIKETFNRYKQFLYDSPRSMRKGKSDG